MQTAATGRTPSLCGEHGESAAGEYSVIVLIQESPSPLRKETNVKDHHLGVTSSLPKVLYSALCPCHRPMPGARRNAGAENCGSSRKPIHTKAQRVGIPCLIRLCPRGSTVHTVLYKYSQGMFAEYSRVV